MMRRADKAVCDQFYLDYLKAARSKNSNLDYLLEGKGWR